MDDTVCPLAAVGKVAAGLKPDLLLTGFIFKETDGIALAEAIRAQLPGLPTLIVTTGALPLPVSLAQDDYRVLAKPFSAGALREAVASLLPHQSAWAQRA